MSLAGFPTEPPQTKEETDKEILQVKVRSLSLYPP